MSGIAAIIRFDGGLVEPGAIEKMTAAMDYRGPDGIRHWTNGPVALGQCMLRTTAESLEEVQPLANEDESLVLVMDGWLSNWEELRSELLTRGARLRTRSDAELVLRAYEVWGEDCPKHIDGEFVFLIWNGRQQVAYLAQDHVGLKSLHYSWDGRQLIVASDIIGVLAGPGVEQKPNHAKIAEFMAYEMIDRTETVWQGVMRALPAQWLRFGRVGTKAGIYWAPPLEVTIRYKRDEDYFEHYRELFADCVRRSSRTHLPLACDVSGGLDSSAVFAMAHDLRRKDRLPAPDIKGYTYFFEGDAGADHDEIEYAREVARHVGEGVREIAPFLPDLAWFTDRGKLDQNFAGYPNGVMSIAIGEALVEDGCRVILNGEGGDEWLGGTPFYFWEHLTERDWPGLVRSFQEDASSIGFARSSKNLVRYGIAHLLPRSMLAMRHKLRAHLQIDSFDRAVCLTSDLMQLLTSRRVAGHDTDFQQIRNRARRSMAMVLTDPSALVTWDQTSRQSARVGYEIRTPMYARKFLEFAFATPERTRLRGDVRKFLHIKALGGLLPDMVSNRKTKANFNVAFKRQMDMLNGVLVSDLRSSDSGYLDASGTERLLERFRRNPHDGFVMWQLWAMYEFDSLLNLLVKNTRKNTRLGM